MKLIKTITEKSLGLSEEGLNPKIDYKKREAARAVVFDDGGKVALIFNTKNNHHKIPGGGVDEGEDLKQALEREVKEEAGCEIEIVKEIGMIKEYRNKIKQSNISYCWLAKLKGNKNEPNFDKDETAMGFTMDWVDIDEALDLFEKNEPKDYFGYFMRDRDYEFLKIAKKMI